MTAINFTLPDGAKPRKVKARTAAPAAAPVPTPAPRVFEPLEGLPATPEGNLASFNVVVAAPSAPVAPKSEYEVLDEFARAIQDAGMVAPIDLVADGKLHRFNPDGKGKDRSGSGWYVLHLDGVPAGIFGDWSTGEGSQKWRAKGESQMTRAEREQCRATIRAMQAARDAKKAQAQQAAAVLALQRWEAAAPAPVDHPYLARKGVEAHGIRADGGVLLLPMRDASGKLHSLQTIHADGNKRFATDGKQQGCRHIIGEVGTTLVVCEGYATGASIHEATGLPVAVAFTAGNLLPVAESLRAQYPTLDLVIAADDDWKKEAEGKGNTGQTKAREAAQAVGAVVVSPVFPDGVERGTDFNDLAAVAGVQVVGEQVKAALQPARTWQADADGVILDEPTFPPLDEAAQPRLTGLALLNSFALNGQSQAMRAKMLDDVHILGKLALMGQITAFYTERNGGKTLLTLWLLIDSIKRGVIDPANVYYINSDDTHKGLVEKTEFAETWGFKMLSDGYNGFKNELLIDVMRGMCEADEARGKVFILDTLKKFTDVMKIEKGTAFMQQLRAFALQGGSVILLGHVNKHRGDDGKLVYKGTTDVVDDADCYYIMDKVQKQDVTIVTFENGKARGDVVTSACYSFQRSREGGQTYAELLDTVQAVDDSEVQKARDEEERAMFAASRQAVIDAIFDAIGAGKTKRTDLITEAHHASGVSKVKVTEVLDKFTGHHWQVTKGQTSGKVYSVLPDTSET